MKAVEALQERIDNLEMVDNPDVTNIEVGITALELIIPDTWNNISWLIVNAFETINQ